MRKYWTHLLIAVLAFLVGSATVASATGHIQKLVISNEDETRTVKVTKDDRLATDVRGKLRITNLTDIQGPVGPPGPQGAKGSKGNKGNQGDPGLACWDLNGNGVGDVNTEDTNGDNAVDVLDCNFSAADFLDRFGTNTASGAYLSATPCDSRIIGEVWMHAGIKAPRQTAFAHGQLLAISQNQALFSLIGIVYGGDGRTTFGLPDMRGLEPEGVNYVICLQGLFP